MGYCVGLTGGIGSGKSTAADLFAARGASVVDTDRLSHQLTAPGGAALRAIRDQYGPEYIGPGGGLDRERMRRLVFQDAAARTRLEAILHPAIREMARERVGAAQSPYVILVVPLLLETGAYLDLVRRVLVVDCSEARQLERAMRRSQLGADEVRAIMATQWSRDARLKRADDVLDNDGEPEMLRRQVDALHVRYLALAGTA